MTSASARVAISSHWLRNSTAPTTCRICWSASPNRHRICTPPSMYHLFGRQSVSEPMYRHLQVSELSLLYYYPICRSEEAPNSPEGMKELHLQTRADHTSPSVSRIWQVVMRCATAISKVVSLQRTSPISDKVENSRQPVIFSRASWITSVPFHPCEEQSAMPRLTTQDYIILNSVFQSRKGRRAYWLTIPKSAVP